MRRAYPNVFDGLQFLLAMPNAINAQQVKAMVPGSGTVATEKLKSSSAKSFLLSTPGLVLKFKPEKLIILVIIDALLASEISVFEPKLK